MKYYKYALVWDEENKSGVDPSNFLNDGTNNYVPIFYTGNISDPYDNQSRVYVMLEEGEIDSQKIQDLDYRHFFTEVAPEEIIEASGE